MTAKLWAISDVHIDREPNRMAFHQLRARPGDWLILAGDVCNGARYLDEALAVATDRYERVLWVPGNHELWANPSRSGVNRGVALYDELIQLCQRRGVITPEDPFPEWPEDGSQTPFTLVPMFLLYDYSFRPDHVPIERALDWAAEGGVLCTDEAVLFPDPHPSRSDWCAARVEATEKRLDALDPEKPLVLVNHFPLRRDLAETPAVPRFIPWCGTRKTEDWHTRYNVKAVVYGHLHIRRTRYREGVRFEEVSFGYPKQWREAEGINAYVRQILPGPTQAPGTT